jgi:hypothetical protein
MRGHIMTFLGALAGIALAASPALASAASVPEPSSLTLVAVGAGAVGLYKLLRRRR